MNFQQFFEKFNQDLRVGIELSIENEIFKVIGATKLTSYNYQAELGYYIKVFLENNAVLIIIPSQESVQFSKTGDLGQINSITDEQVGISKIVEYDGKRFQLENPHDYQYTLELLCGKFEDVEGECRFSDYICLDDDQYSLSLGWLMKDGKRADVLAKNLSLDSISFVK